MRQVESSLMVLWGMGTETSRTPPPGALTRMLPLVQMTGVGGEANRSATRRGGRLTSPQIWHCTQPPSGVAHALQASSPVAVIWIRKVGGKAGGRLEPF
eukprot:CAMPEP_0173423750 /NCGR_PEP_ID=MMETSP1357-20121228/3928_1 /TAXON_ID=77926 /ORGANISM="Hemiselmis rufescens, Strain PCC563" /LENGTH=98 /DNA_ID=CAMNT_0014386901 /DNA_START=300 /DNA_END=593 /DNA_ORIENTATION=-